MCTAPGYEDQLIALMRPGGLKSRLRLRWQGRNVTSFTGKIEFAESRKRNVPGVRLHTHTLDGTVFYCAGFFGYLHSGIISCLQRDIGFKRQCSLFAGGQFDASEFTVDIGDQGFVIAGKHSAGKQTCVVAAFFTGLIQ